VARRSPKNFRQSKLQIGVLQLSISKLKPKRYRVVHRPSSANPQDIALRSSTAKNMNPSATPTMRVVRFSLASDFTPPFPKAEVIETLARRGKLSCR
jgi:hypothetical protein